MRTRERTEEVSCRNLDASLRVLSQRHIDAQEWLADFPLSLPDIADRSKWISWNEYRALMDRFAALVGPEAAALTGAAWVDASDAAKFIRSAARVLMDPYWVYWMSVKLGGPSVWPTVRGEVGPLEGRCFRVTVDLLSPYEGCEFWFDATHHVMRLLPTTLGCPPATVATTRAHDFRSATFDITLPPSQVLLPRAVAALRGLLNASALPNATWQLDALETSLARVSEQQRQVEALCDQLTSATENQRAVLASPPSDDYRAELQAHFTLLKAKNRRFSLRAFARKLGLSPAMLSNVLSGQRNLSADMALLIAARLGYSALDAQRFCRAVQLSQIADPKARLLFSH